MPDDVKDLVRQAVDWYKPSPPDPADARRRARARSRRTRALIVVVALGLVACSFLFVFAAFRQRPAPAPHQPAAAIQRVVDRLQSLTTDVKGQIRAVGDVVNQLQRRYRDVLRQLRARPNPGTELRARAERLQAQLAVQKLRLRELMAQEKALAARIEALLAQLPTPTPTTLPKGSGRVSAVLALPGTSSAIVAGPKGILYLAVESEAGSLHILRWDPSDGSVVARRAMPGAQPGVQIALARSSLWAAWGKAAYRLDPASLQVVQRVALPSVPGVLGASPDGSVWVGVDGDLLVLDSTSGGVTQIIPVSGTPKLISFDPGGSHAYIETSARAGEDGDLLVELDATTGRRIASAAVGVRELAGASSMAATSDGVWMSTPTGMMGGAFFLPEGTLRGGHQMLPGEQAPGTNAVAVSLAGGTVWVSDQGTGEVSCLDPTTGKVLDRFTMARSSDANYPYGRLVTQGGSALYMDGSLYLLRLDPPRACGTSR
jgi:streptogramin lyase